MKPLPYLVGLVLSAVALFFAYTDGGYHSKITFFVAAMGSSYIVYSTIGFILTRYGRTKRSKAWAFFGCGIILLFGYIPSTRFIIELFYVSRELGNLAIDRELFYYAPMIVSGLCIYRSFSLWADESLDAKEPNQSLEPTRVLGTSAAEPPRVPSTRVAHL